MLPPHTVELAAPTLLVAMPHLNGGPFAQAVVLLVRHDATGSMGLMLQKPSSLSVGTFTKNLGVHFVGRGPEHVHVGGPVDHERAFVLHGGAHRGPDTRALLPQLAMSFSMESLTALAKDAPVNLRICIGYAGWGAAQLAHEITLGAWMLAPASAPFVFDTPPEAMWHRAVQLMGFEPLQLKHRPGARA